GDFRPGGSAREYCDEEILRRIKRRTLAKLRNEVAPVDRVAIARFLPAWHGVGEAQIGAGRLEETLIQLEGLPLSFHELETVILPARVRGFRPQQLDELGAMGWLVWVGHAPLGSDDGRVAFYRRERVGRLLEPREDPSAQPFYDERHQKILERLRQRGACFFAEFEAVLSAVSRTEVLEALWDLVWSGQITNDTCQSLRSLRNRQQLLRPRRGRSKPLVAGRWSLVPELLIDAPSATERAHARAVSMLERYGVVTREVAALEGIAGGFTQTYRVLRAMEEAGKIRRGYFVEGLSGAQFAYPGAIDRLRSFRDGDHADEVRVLSAVDPANAYGWLLPWPEWDGEGGVGPRRIAGATLVTCGGEPVLFLDRKGKRLRTFKGVTRERLLPAAKALIEVAKRKRGKVLRIEQIDGQPARQSPHAPVLREASFGSDHRGLTLEAN
ncbi:MAG: DEAD/DEAH box helicase, partial [Myxococcota bacterium]